MEKMFGESVLSGTVLQSYKADVYFDGKKLQRIDKETYSIKRTKKVHKFIQLRYNDQSGEWVNHDGDDTQGVAFVIREKEFSEQSGTKWVSKRFVFCEPQ